MFQTHNKNNNETVKVVHVNKRAKRENHDDDDHEKHLIVVKFHQFSEIKYKKDTDKYSPVFERGGARWKLQLRFSKQGAQSGEGSDSPQGYHLGMYLCLDEAPWLLGEEYSVNYAASIPKLDITKTSGESTFRLGKSNGCGWRRVTTMKRVLDRGLDDDILSIHIKFDQLEHICKRWTSSLSFNKERLKMIRTGTLADITFVVGTGDQQQRIKANTMFVLAGAPAMKSFIDEATTVEEEDGDGKSISFPTIDPDHFRFMLRFIYADDTSFLTDDTTQRQLQDLLIVANRFGCWKLKILLETKMTAKHLHLSSCVDLLLFADANSCYVLKEESIKVVGKNMAKVLRQREAGQLIESVELMREIHQYASCEDLTKTTGDEFSQMRIDELYEWLEKRDDVMLEEDMDRPSLLKKIRSLEIKQQNGNSEVN
uniref:BTB domain-containing protein n=1 Tax=Craspedostauros australis TaxID=1486917 RepID=A0A7R9WZQ5_9STRA|mmetsp:Transcript_3977/g.10519  ORF Transcript_3977/g.10519 Transcript_3977/m.10519 type:complete len:427 (+) Transcript_3977:137-1417(+)